MRTIALILLTLWFYKCNAQLINYIDSTGRKQGEWQEFYDKDHKLILRKANYVDGKLDGKVFTYDKNRNLQKVQYYLNGIYLFHKTYYTKGKNKGKIETLGGLKVDRTVSKHRYIIDSSEIKCSEINSFDSFGNKKGIWHEVVVLSINVPYYEEYYAVGNYLNGKKEGKWKYYRYEGKQLIKEIDYTADIMSGKYLYYNLRGDITVIYNFVNGKRNGEYLTYYDNGNIRYKGTMKEDKLIGEYFEYNAKGKLTKHVKDASKTSPY